MLGGYDDSFANIQVWSIARAVGDLDPPSEPYRGGTRLGRDRPRSAARAVGADHLGGMDDGGQHHRRSRSAHGDPAG
jgi:hypothetical protein